MLHDAKSVANELIRRANEAGRPLTPMQVQKLIYFCQAWMLGLYGQSLIKQPVEAWQYGPVVRDVYNNLRKYGRNPVTSPIRCKKEDYSAREENLIDQVWEKYGHFTGPQLSTLSHEDGTPWHHVWYHPSITTANPIIPEHLIREHYQTKYKEAQNGSE